MAARILPICLLSLVLFSDSVATSNVHAGGSDLEYKIWFEPKTPVIGSTYKMHIQVWNADPHFAQHVRAAIYKLPEKDRLLSPSKQQQRLMPRGSHTFVFEIQCGSEKGNITWDVVPEWDD